MDEVREGSLHRDQFADRLLEPSEDFLRGRRQRARCYTLATWLGRGVDPGVDAVAGVDAGVWPSLGAGREGGGAVVPVARKPVSHPIL